MSQSYITLITRKAPGALDPAVVLPPLRGVKHIKITQDTIPSPCSEKHGEYLSGRAKTRSLGQVTKKKQEKPQGH